MSSSKYDNAFKQRVLVEGIDKKVAIAKRINYKNSIEYTLNEEDGEMKPYFVNGVYYDFLLYCKQVPSLDCALRINESKKRKSSRVRRKIEDLVLNSSAIFITLTFNDNTFAKTSADKRRRLVQRYLKDNCKKYVANVDFGSNKEYIDDYGNKRVATEREHYHAVVSNDVVFDAWYKYGAVKVERVRPYEDSNVRLSRYITKLTNHALKVEGLQPRLIYSRCTI